MIAPAFTAAASASLSGRADDQTQTQKALASVSVSVSDASFASAGSVKVVSAAFRSPSCLPRVRLSGVGELVGWEGVGWGDGTGSLRQDLSSS